MNCIASGSFFLKFPFELVAGASAAKDPYLSAIL